MIALIRSITMNKKVNKKDPVEKCILLAQAHSMGNITKDSSPS